MRTLLPNLVLAALTAAVLGGCASEKPELTKADQQKMDTLFREGIKNPPSNAAGGTPAGKSTGKPMNQDGG